MRTRLVTTSAVLATLHGGALDRVRLLTDLHVTKGDKSGATGVINLGTSDDNARRQKPIPGVPRKQARPAPLIRLPKLRFPATAAALGQLVNGTGIGVSDRLVFAPSACRAQDLKPEV